MLLGRKTLFFAKHLLHILTSSLSGHFTMRRKSAAYGGRKRTEGAAREELREELEERGARGAPRERGCIKTKCISRISRISLSQPRERSLRSEVNNSLIIVNFFHKIQNFRQSSDLFSQIWLKKRHTSLFSGIWREIRKKIHQKLAEKMQNSNILRLN